ncbi:response regulator [Leptolyngbya sp. 7M]|uniref:response regulator n=1 Tax=Leptolyngbya sp. 7M TaxID=2812896 RepID=UPI001B8D05AB|nr:response regulator transcription factor [Leptolyngbya sp. 7M]QYO62271.1 response regulator transcription factor [Leptolyngbya sp. 7M]
MYKDCSISAPSATSVIRLLLVDDQALIRHGLKTMLELEADLQVVGVASNGTTAIEQVSALQPDLVLMDVRMPEMDGRAATRAICQQFPAVKVLVLSTFDDDQYIVDAMRAGAKGYLLKDMPVDELAQAIRLAHRGYTQIAPGLMEKLIANSSGAQMVPSQQILAALATLTPREREVLYLIGDGSTNREIAEKLYISESTVKTHVMHLFSRLNLRNRAQLAIYANSVGRIL